VIPLVAAWAALWGLFTMLMVTTHGTPVASAAVTSFQMMVAASIAAVPAYRFTQWRPLPHPFRVTFIFEQLAAAAVFSVSWFLLISGLQSLVLGHRVLVLGPGLAPFLATGMWLYFAVAGVAYSLHAQRRAAELQANAARTQLAALRAQLHPHFLFNALHTVVQLVPTDPKAAQHAAEQLAEALRTTLDEQRDTLPLADEWAFVERYLALETIRFGDRLVLQVDIEPDAREAMLPSFALQTLVENAVRHGAGPRPEATRVGIRAWREGRNLKVTVVDDGGGASIESLRAARTGGIDRLRERMRTLYGDSARLELGNLPGSGFTAALTIAQDDDG